MPNTKFPGVYAIARCQEDIADSPFEWRREIIYIGMTNAISGLRGRLLQFDYTISGKCLAHGGADRVRAGYKSYNYLEPLLYVATVHFRCDPRSNLPADLRKMGLVCRFEYACFAEYAERFRCLPRFNDKSLSKKFSKQRNADVE